VAAGGGRAAQADGRAARERLIWLITFRRLVTFRRLEAVSIIHSCVYSALLVCAFALGNPQPETFILGMAHGVIWICMSLICIVAARARIIPFWLAVTVAVLGGLGPFMGTIGFLYESHRRAKVHREFAVTVESNGG
jgi:hypothetical protein